MLFYATVNKCTLSLSRFLRGIFYQFFSTKGQDRKTRQCGGSCRPPTFRFHFAHQWSNSFSPRTQGRGTADQQFGICASVGYRAVSFLLGWALFCKSFLFWILAFSTNLYPIRIDMSGNTVWPQASGFQKLAKMDHFWHFWWSECKGR